MRLDCFIRKERSATSGAPKLRCFSCSFWFKAKDCLFVIWNQFLICLSTVVPCRPVSVFSWHPLNKLLSKGYFLAVLHPNEEGLNERATEKKRQTFRTLLVQHVALLLPTNTIADCKRKECWTNEFGPVCVWCGCAKKETIIEPAKPTKKRIGQNSRRTDQKEKGLSIGKNHFAQ